MVKGASKISGPAAFAVGALQIAEGVEKDGGDYGDNAKKATAEVAGGTLGGIGGAALGAEVGLAIGSLGGPAGAAIGTVVGGVVGGIAGALGGGEAGGAIYEEVKNKPEDDKK